MNKDDEFERMMSVDEHHDAYLRGIRYASQYDPYQNPYPPGSEEFQWFQTGFNRAVELQEEPILATASTRALFETDVGGDVPSSIHIGVLESS